MKKEKPVVWSERALLEADRVSVYLEEKFSIADEMRFKALLRRFEKQVSRNPEMAPASLPGTAIRRAIIHPNTSIFYIPNKRQILVVSVRDNRQSNDPNLSVRELEIRYPQRVA